MIRFTNTDRLNSKGDDDFDRCHFGLPLDATYTDHTGRPRFLVTQGAPIRELVG